MSTDTKNAEAGSTEVALPAHTIRAIEKFLANHGGSASAVIDPIGYSGVRINLVGADGVLGDQVVADLVTATAVVASLDQVTQKEWVREVTSIATPRQGHYAKMAGWVARQKRFPKARNGL